jgi:hypothetical protein
MFVPPDRTRSTYLLEEVKVRSDGDLDQIKPRRECVSTTRMMMPFEVREERRRVEE